MVNLLAETAAGLCNKKQASRAANASLGKPLIVFLSLSLPPVDLLLRRSLCSSDSATSPGWLNLLS